MRFPSLHVVTALVVVALGVSLAVDRSEPQAPEIDAGFGAHAPEEPPPLGTEADGFPAAVVELTDASMGGPERVEVRVAHTPSQRRQGLMEVEHLPDGVGMLFVMSGDTDSGFWMKDTRVPLDIAWIDSTGRIVAIAQMQPCRSDPCPTYRPGRTYRYALEVREGWLAEVGATVGSRLVVPVECAVIADGDVRLNGTGPDSARETLRLLGALGRDRCEWMPGS